MKFSRKTKWVKTDAWRGYQEPVYGIAGVADTGMWEDSPAKSDVVGKEINDFKKELRKLGVPTRMMTTRTSNVFAGQHHLIAPVELYPSAKEKVRQVLKKKKWEYIFED